MTTKLIAQLKKITGMNDIPFVSAGVAADENISGHVITEDGVTALVEASIAGEAAAASLSDQALQAQQAVAAQQAAESLLATANTNLATANTRITTLEARVADLEEEAPITPTSKKEDKHGKDKTPYHLSENNPCNQAADKYYGVPITEKK